MMGLLGIARLHLRRDPGLITRSVPAREVGSAMGFYQVVRSIGFSAGSALVASLLASHAVAGSSFPAVGGYTTALWVGAGMRVFATVVAVAMAPREGRTAWPPTEEELETWRDDAELASAGLIDGEAEVRTGR